MLKTLKSKLYRKSKTQGCYVLRDTIIFLVAFCFFVPCFLGDYKGVLSTEGSAFFSSTLGCFPQRYKFVVFQSVVFFSLMP